jgi:hypothetical protein
MLLTVFFLNIFFELLTGLTEAALFVLIVVDTSEKIFAPEIRPQDIQKLQLSIGNLPKQKVADPHFTAGTDKQVYRRKIFGVQMIFKDLFGYFIFLVTATVN